MYNVLVADGSTKKNRDRNKSKIKCVNNLKSRTMPQFKKIRSVSMLTVN